MTNVNTHSGFLFHLMRPSEHLELMSYTRTPISLAHATNWPFHLIFCTPPSASHRTVDFSRDKKVFSCSTNRSSPAHKDKEMWYFGSCIIKFYNVHNAPIFCCKKGIVPNVFYQLEMHSHFIILAFSTATMSVLTCDSTYPYVVFMNSLLKYCCLINLHALKIPCQ
jgi:hypothetical protein